MKIGNHYKLLLTFASALALAVTLPFMAAIAQDALPAPAVPAAADAALPAPVATAAPAAVVDTTVPPPPAVAPPTLTPTMPTVATMGMPVAGASIPNAPANMPSVVGQVMSDLEQSQKNVSLDDVSRAQDALVRLDLMLQIEQRMNELKKVQDERNNAAVAAPISPFGAPSGGMAQIPAGALALPTQPVAIADTMPSSTHHRASHDEPATDPADYKLEQISGTNGDLTAVLVTGDGDKKNVRVGDSVGGRMKVASISASGVQLQGPKGKTKLIGIDHGVSLAPLTR